MTAGFNSRQDITSLAYAASQPLWSKSYHWDTNAQNLLSVTDQITGAVRSFTYDNVNRLISATDSSGSLSDTYTPDAWGNRQESGTFSFAQPFSAANQISATGYSYDAAGNLTADGLGNSYSYDADGKMSASNGAVYTRDPLGQRIVKNYAGAATEYYYFGGQLLATRDPSSSQWTDYIYAGGRLIAEAPSGTTDTVFYRIGDHLDSLAQKTDSTGDLLGTNDISPYGELISNTAEDRLLFTQHERDTENGSDATLYRQYASAQGRWLSPDPSNTSYDLTDPQSLNRYAYLSGRPLASVDSLGLDDDGCWDDDGSDDCGDPILGSIFGGGGGGGGHHGNPHSTADTGYGSPDNDNGTDVYPPYVTQQSSDPGSFGESLGIPTGISHGVLGIGPALGLPSSDSCDFGACGGSANFGPGDPSSTVDEATFAGGLYLIYHRYLSMKKANVKNSDKYFHCTAMAEASALIPGGEAAAVTASWGREFTDTFKYRWYLITGNKHGLNFKDSIADSKEDLKADYAGINGGYGACAQYWVRGLP